MKRIAYIGLKVPGTDVAWGGSIATNYAYQKAFADDAEYRLDLLPRDQIGARGDIDRFFAGADITHVDDTGTIGDMFKWGMDAPDIIGPVTRSPVKCYGSADNPWVCPYTREWFYRARVIRLNYSEERKYKQLVTLITQGVDTGLLQPDWSKAKTAILWAGQKNRYAKNYDLWQEIIANAPPPGYEWRTMSGFAVKDYWAALDYAACYVCTSRYETYCAAAFEAMSKGVPVVWAENLQGGFWDDAGRRVPATVEGFLSGIHDALSGPAAGRKAREYCEAKSSLAVMRESYRRVFKEVLEGKANQ